MHREYEEVVHELEEFTKWTSENVPYDKKEFPNPRDAVRWFLAYRLADDLAQWSVKEIARMINENLSIGVSDYDDLVSAFEDETDDEEGKNDLHSEILAFYKE